MARFIYKAKKGPAETMEGAIEADSEKIAINRLVRLGYYPISVKEELKNAERVAVYRINSKRLADFTRHLSELLSAGITLYNALSLMENQSENKNLKIITKAVKGYIKDGKKFSEALENYPGTFSELYVNIVRAGEESGSLNEALLNIADLSDKDEDIRAKIITASAYPVLMALVGLGTIFILVAFIVPRLVDMFIEMGEKLPLPTRMLIAISGFVRVYWIWMIFFTAGAVFLLKNIGSDHVAKIKLDKIKLKIPIFGNLIKDAEFARFSRTFSMLLKNGVSMLSSLKIVSGVITNSAIKEDAGLIYEDIKSGASLAIAIKKTGSFPLMVGNMIAVGEEGGFLDKALLNVARSYEKELENKVKTITTLLEPVFILIMGLVIGFIVIAMLLPVFQISLVSH
ncbi:MAG: type II secretion system F family protein [Candidatus Omnitrophota bacterium]|nr:type II secretion system F family protein [Candidatus Omnitrophota bacterium]